MNPGAAHNANCFLSKAEHKQWILSIAEVYISEIPVVPQQWSCQDDTGQHSDDDDLDAHNVATFFLTKGCCSTPLLPDVNLSDVKDSKGDRSTEVDSDTKNGGWWKQTNDEATPFGKNASGSSFQVTRTGTWESTVGHGALTRLRG